MANFDERQSFGASKGNSEDSLLVIYVLRILKQYSSPKSPLSSQDVVEYLKKDYSIGFEEKAEALQKKVRRHLDTLYESYPGRCIKKREGKTRIGHKWYYDVARDRLESAEGTSHETLTETEIELLVDLISATKILNSRGTLGLVDKLLRKTNASAEDRAKRLAAIGKEAWLKTPNEDLIGKKDFIQDCIDECDVVFDYESEEAITATPIGWSDEDGICLLNAKVGNRYRKFSLDKIRNCDTVAQGPEDADFLGRYGKEREIDQTTLDSLFVNIPTIKSAIAEKRCLRFLYRSYSIEKDRVIFTNEEKSVLPHSLVFNNGKYYLIGIDENAPELNKIAYFRVDFMFEVYGAETKMKLSDWDAYRFETMERAREVEKHPLMLAGKDVALTFKVAESALDRVMDAFAVKQEQFRVTEKARAVKNPYGDGYHEERLVSVQVRTTEEEAFRWALANADAIELVSPQRVRDRIARLATPIYHLYTQTVSDKVRENIDYIMKEGRFRISHSVDEKTAADTLKELKAGNRTEIVDKIYFAKDNCEPKSDLAVFTNTKDLRICRSPKCKSLSWASAFPKLETFHLTETGVDDVSWLKELRKLKWVEIYDSPIHDLSMLKDHPSIYTLRLHKTDVKDIRFLEHYQHLDLLTLIECPIEDYSPLFKIPSYVKVLEIDKRAASQIDLEKLKERYIGISIYID